MGADQLQFAEIKSNEAQRQGFGAVFFIIRFDQPGFIVRWRWIPVAKRVLQLGAARRSATVCLTAVCVFSVGVSATRVVPRLSALLLFVCLLPGYQCRAASRNCLPYCSTAVWVFAAEVSTPRSNT